MTVIASKQIFIKRIIVKCHFVAIYFAHSAMNIAGAEEAVLLLYKHLRGRFYGGGRVSIELPLWGKSRHRL